MMRRQREEHPMVLSSFNYLPPPPPTSTRSRLPVDDAAFSSRGPRRDRISELPEDVKRLLVSMLPVKDGARTAVLSTSWRWIWSSTPLVLDDAQLVPAAADDDADLNPAAAARSRAEVAKKVSAVLASHPGPFRLVRITSSDKSRLRAWTRILVAKGVGELVVLNRAWAGDIMALPPEILRCASLERLHLALSHLPSLVWPGRPHRRRVSFPVLRQLVLCHAFLPAADVGQLLAGCPALEFLSFIMGFGVPQHIDVRCPRLKCLVLWLFKPLKMKVTDAPCLERLILWQTTPFAVPPKMTIRIDSAPKLRVVGYLEPRMHVLKIGDTIISAGMNVSPGTMVPSVEILAIKIRFGVPEDESMLLSFLRVFPNVTTLHIKCTTTQLLPERKHDPCFWIKNISSIPCFFQMKKLAIYEFHGTANGSELEFITSIVETCASLNKMLITTLAASDLELPKWMEPEGSVSTTTPEVQSASSETISLNIIQVDRREWKYRTASDMSLVDPFDYMI